MNFSNMPVKKLFYIVIIVGVVGIVLQSSIIALVWFTIAEINELETPRNDAETEEAKDMRVQSLITNFTNRIIEGQNAQDSLTRNAIEILLGNTERINIIGNGTANFQQDIIRQLNETMDEMDNRTEVLSGRIDQLIELLAG